MVPPAILRHHTLKFELQFIDVSGVFLPAWPFRDPGTLATLWSTNMTMENHNF